ncbi:MAG: ABC transporter permease [Actinomycetota bacterium]|nr:MAG: antibiotic transport system permease [Actinomycetota bacterium]MDP3629387.1 ABC transporter permease [Actinomycetota bacterium]
MRRILALAWLNALQLLRNPAEMVGVIVLPLALTMLFGSAFSGGEAKPMQVLLADEDGTSYSAQVGTLIDAEESFETSAVTRAEAENLIAKGDAAVAVIVPKGFETALKGSGATIEVLRDPASQNSFAVISVVQGVAMRMSGNAGAAEVVVSMLPPGAADFDTVYKAANARWEPTPPIYTKGETVVASEVRGDSVIAQGATLSSIGFTVWFILFMTFGSAGGILEEREQGTLRRLLVAPISRGTIMSGKVVGIVLAASVQALILVGVGALAFGVPWGRDPLAVFVVLESYVLAGTGLAVLVSALVRTRDQLSGLSPLISTGLAMLGGCLWPIEVVAPFMQTIAKFTPTGWAVMGLTDVVARNQGMEAAVVPSLVLLGFAAVSLLLGSRLLRFE